MSCGSYETDLRELPQQEISHSDTKAQTGVSDSVGALSLTLPSADIFEDTPHYLVFELWKVHPSETESGEGSSIVSASQNPSLSQGTDTANWPSHSFGPDYSLKVKYVENQKVEFPKVEVGGYDLKVFAFDFFDEVVEEGSTIISIIKNRHTKAVVSLKEVGEGSGSLSVGIIREDDDTHNPCGSYEIAPGEPHPCPPNDDPNCPVSNGNIAVGEPYPCVLPVEPEPLPPEEPMICGLGGPLMCLIEENTVVDKIQSLDTCQTERLKEMGYVSCTQ